MAKRMKRCADGSMLNVLRGLIARPRKAEVAPAVTAPPPVIQTPMPDVNVGLRGLNSQLQRAQNDIVGKYADGKTGKKKVPFKKFC